MTERRIVDIDDVILVTGAGGFIGSRVVTNLLDRGFTKIRCMARPSSDSERMYKLLNIRRCDERIEIFYGNLLSREDCEAVTESVQLIYHLAAGRGQKLIPDAYLNSVVTTRNLLDATIKHDCLRRLVNVSSFTVYTNRNKPRKHVLDEICPIEKEPAHRWDAYCYAKVKQEEIVHEYAAKYNLKYVNLRPGVVYGPGNEGIHGRVGIGTFGVFLHLGGSNKIPLVYVDNCADAIVLAGLCVGIDGETFNLVDDDLPSSREFLRQYKKRVKNFYSVYIPPKLSYGLCYIWERLSIWSKGQLPMVYNRKNWHVAWKKTFYPNDKIKGQLGWKQKVSSEDGLRIHFKSCRDKLKND